MASPTVDIGTGTTIVFGTSGFTSELLGIDWSGLAREAIETSHMGTTGQKTFTPGDLSDPGEIKASFHFDPDQTPPIDSAAETITITFPGGATWAGSGFCTGFDLSDPMEDKMTATMTIKISGEITITTAT